MGLIKGAVNIAAAIGACFVTLLAIIITVYTAVKLSDVSFDPTNVFNADEVTSESFCALGTTSNTTIAGINTSSVASSNCLFIEILGGITIGIGILIGIVQCWTCNLCGLGGILDFIFAILASAAWLAAGIVVTDVYNKNLDSTDPAVEAFDDERNTLMIMVWVEFALFALIVLSSLMKCCGCLCGKKE